MSLGCISSQLFKAAGAVRRPARASWGRSPDRAPTQMKHTHIIIAIDGLTASITLLSYNGSGLTVLFWDVGCICSENKLVTGNW